MIRACLVVHRLSALRASESEASGPFPTWSFLSACAAPDFQWTVLHTQHAKREEQLDLQAACTQAGAVYAHIEDHPLPVEAPVHPAVEALRIGWQLVYALGNLAPDLIVFGGDPSHAAEPIAARHAALPRFGCAIVVAIEALRKRRRLENDVFPELGREDLATDFLERKTLADADGVIFLDPKDSEWTGSQGWALSSVAGPMNGDLKALLRSALEAARADLVRAPKFPTVALCIPHFEQPAQLMAALEDLVAQTRMPDELIVVDDGSCSTEAVATFDETARRFAREGWQFLRQQNAGPAAARNWAARVAQSETLLFCDADNRYCPDMVETLARAYARTGAMAVTCAFHALRQGVDPSLDPGYFFVPLGSCMEAAMFENTIADTNTLVNRQAFLDVGGFPSGGIVEDWRCYLKMLDRGHRFEVVPKALFAYTVAKSGRNRQRGEFQPALDAITPYLEGAHPIWKRLWPYAAGAIRHPRLTQLEGVLADLRVRSEQTVEEVRREARHFWAEAVLAEAQCNEVRKRERHALGLLEGKTSTERARIQTLEAELQRLQQELEKNTAILRQREDKLKRLQSSASWSLTAPLRAARRLVVDPFASDLGAHPGHAGTASQAPSASATTKSASETPTEPTCYHYFIEAPHHWRIRDEPFAVRGWCFYEDVDRTMGIRARVGDRVFEGVHGLGRHDIAAIMPQWQQAANSGFRIEVLLHGNDRRLDIELLDGNGRWRRFVDIDLTAEPTEPPKGSYDHWVAKFDTLTESHLAAFKARADLLASGPLISVLLPVFNTDPRWLERALASVRAQAYPRWELCIADDASTEPRIRPILEAAAALDLRIRLCLRERNGHICEATNSALELATGELCVLFDHDDELRPHSLLMVAEEFAAHPDAELVYSDEDKIDELGRRFDPHFKPDWNPDLLSSQNYVCHLAAFRTATLRALGGMRPGFEGSQDWDLFLRLSERVSADSIRHIPRILYHWRAVPGSTAVGADQKDYAARAAERALTEHYARTGVRATLEQTAGGHWRARLALPLTRPLVSILIASHNAADLVRLCIASLVARTDYAPFEIVLVDNRSDAPDALALFDELERNGIVRLLRYPHPFNYSAINNFAAREARGEILCLLNNDIEIRDGGWLTEMVSHAVRPEIGAVGTRLLFPDLTVQHAGVIVGLGGVAGHGFKRFHRNEPGHQFRPHLVHNLSAVTAACLVIRRKVYEEVGGLDEVALPVAFNDVDFCLRVQARGYRNLYTPFAEIIHHESATRGSDNTPEKVERFRREIEAIKTRWGDSLLTDPAYNPNLSLDSEDFAFAYPPRLPDLARS